MSSLPEAVAVKNDDFTIDANYEAKDGQLLYQVRVEIPNAEINAENLQAWNTAIESLATFYEAPIVLVKS